MLSRRGLFPEGIGLCLLYTPEYITVKYIPGSTPRSETARGTLFFLRVKPIPACRQNHFDQFCEWVGPLQGLRGDRIGYDRRGQKGFASDWSRGIPPCGDPFRNRRRDGVGADMDLLVLTERDGMDAKIAASLRKHGSDYAIDYFVVSHGKWIKHLREGSPFVKMVQKEGRVLYMKEAMEEWQQLAMEDLRQARI